MFERASSRGGGESILIWEYSSSVPDPRIDEPVAAEGLSGTTSPLLPTLGRFRHFDRSLLGIGYSSGLGTWISSPTGGPSVTRVRWCKANTHNWEERAVRELGACLEIWALTVFEVSSQRLGRRVVRVPHASAPWLRGHQQLWKT